MEEIDSYVRQFEPLVHMRLQHIRAVAHAALPEYEEVISYAMPTIRYQGKAILSFDGHAHHIGIYPNSSLVIPEIPDLLDYVTSKGAIQEPFDKPLPDSVIQKIIQVRIQQLFGK